MKTIYQCCRIGKDVNKTLEPIHCEPTGELAVLWLENNGGGVYRNILHNFQYPVLAKPEE
jgi:hypothetical protein